MASAAMPAFLSPAFLSFVSSACAPDAAPSTTAAARIQPRRAATRKPTTPEFLSIAPRRGLALPSRRRPRPDWPAAHSPDPLFRLFPAGATQKRQRARFFCNPDARLTLGPGEGLCDLFRSAAHGSGDRVRHERGSRSEEHTSEIQYLMRTS